MVKNKQRALVAVRSSKGSAASLPDIESFVKETVTQLTPAHQRAVLHLLPACDQQHGSLEAALENNNAFWECLVEWQKQLKAGRFEHPEKEPFTTEDFKHASWKDENFERYWGERLHMPVPTHDVFALPPTLPTASSKGKFKIKPKENATTLKIPERFDKKKARPTPRRNSNVYMAPVLDDTDGDPEDDTYTDEEDEDAGRRKRPPTKRKDLASSVPDDDDDFQPQPPRAIKNTKGSHPAKKPRLESPVSPKMTNKAANKPKQSAKRPAKRPAKSRAAKTANKPDQEPMDKDAMTVEPENDASHAAPAIAPKDTAPDASNDTAMDQSNTSATNAPNPTEMDASHGTEITVSEKNAVDAPEPMDIDHMETNAASQQAPEPTLATANTAPPQPIPSQQDDASKLSMAPIPVENPNDQEPLEASPAIQLTTPEPSVHVEPSSTSSANSTSIQANTAKEAIKETAMETQNTEKEDIMAAAIETTKDEVVDKAMDMDEGAVADEMEANSVVMAENASINKDTSVQPLLTPDHNRAVSNTSSSSTITIGKDEVAAIVADNVMPDASSSSSPASPSPTVPTTTTTELHGYQDDAAVGNDDETSTTHEIASPTPPIMPENVENEEKMQESPNDDEISPVQPSMPDWQYEAQQKQSYAALQQAYLPASSTQPSFTSNSQNYLSQHVYLQPMSQPQQPASQPLSQQAYFQPPPLLPQQPQQQLPRTVPARTYLPTSSTASVLGKASPSPYASFEFPTHKSLKVGAPPSPYAAEGSLGYGMGSSIVPGPLTPARTSHSPINKRAQSPQSPATSRRSSQSPTTAANTGGYPIVPPASTSQHQQYATQTSQQVLLNANANAAQPDQTQAPQQPPNTTDATKNSFFSNGFNFFTQ